MSDVLSLAFRFFKDRTRVSGSYKRATRSGRKGLGLLDNDVTDSLVSEHLARVLQLSRILDGGHEPGAVAVPVAHQMVLEKMATSNLTFFPFKKLALIQFRQ